ncbi:hypothetical protein SOVF_022420 [Spinacia oleracea]|nr:hypothetical protein SOVF_022420 [Spinacia oleracea]
MDIAFSNYGHEWRKMRKIFFSELMSNARLDASYYLRKQHVKKMMYEIHTKAGQLVDVGELTFVAIVSSVMSMIWGDTLKGAEGTAVDAKYRAVATEQMELLGTPNISDLFPFLARFDLQGIAHRMKKLTGCSEHILDLAINSQNTGENNKQKGFLGYLLQLTKFEDPATSLTLPQVKAILTPLSKQIRGPCCSTAVKGHDRLCEEPYDGSHNNENPSRLLNCNGNLAVKVVGYFVGC